MLGIFPRRLLRSAPSSGARMKVTYPLSLKISLWLLLNLVLLAAAGAALYWTQFGRGWESLTVGAVGERLQTIGDAVMAELHAAAPAEREITLARRGQRAGVDLFIFANNGQQLLGPEVALPPPLADELQRGPMRGPPGERGFGRGPPPEAADRIAPKRGPLGNARPPGLGRMVFRAENPPATWIGLRVPYRNSDDTMIAATLFIRAPSLFGIVRFLALLPWLGVLAGGFALSILFWLPLVAGIMHALRQLTRATEAIAEGQFDTRVPESRRDELGQLGRSVNRMAARLDTLVNGQKRFLGDVAHELGSPLGRLQVATEILETRADPALRDHVADVRDEVQQMAALVNELLAFTKAGMRARDAELSNVDVAALIAAVLAREDPTARVQPGIPAGLHVRADPPLLARALGNLIRNALRYAGERATITVTAQRDSSSITLVVEDDGPGVPPEALARLGEPFYRPESARTRETGGVGLGLAIVRSSIAACGGEVRFANRAPHGFRAEVRLAAR